MRTGELARRAGVKLETIRFYEREGLIEEPPRSGSGYRNYPAGALARVRFIRRGRELGFTLSELRELLALRADPRRSCGDVRQRAEARLEDVKDRIRTLQRMRRVLLELIEACEGDAPTSECPILEALEHEIETKE